MDKRKICVVTGTRAEYGLLYWLRKKIVSVVATKECIEQLQLHLKYTKKLGE